jgi:general stress protein 26
MRETPAEIAALQDLMDASYGRSTEHLRSIVTAERRPTAAQLVPALDGMKLLSLATVTARGEPRVSAVDGHFLHGRWTFSTAGGSAKARHLRARPAVSVAHLDGERLGVFCHGQATELTEADPGWAETFAHWTAHYGSDPRTWAEDIRMYRLEPSWFVAYGVLDGTS